MNSDTIQKFIIPLVGLFVALIVIGTSTKTTYVLFMALIENEDYKKAFVLVRKKILAAIFAMCAADLLLWVASVYGFS